MATLDVRKDKTYKQGITKVWIEGSESTDNHFYYNIVLHNPIDSGVFLNANFKETRAIPIITNPEEWHCAVSRFSIPTQAIPLFTLAADSTNYSFTLSYNGTDYTRYVQAIDSNHTVFSEYWQFIDRLNATLLALYNDVVADNPGATLPTEAPFIIFDPPTQLTSLIVTQDYDPDVLSPTIEIWSNLNLYHKFFVGYRQTNPGGTDLTLAKRAHYTVTNVGNNVGFFQDPLEPPPICGTGCTGPIYYNMSGETVNIGLLNETIGIVFTSDSIPSRSEAIPLNTASTSNASRKILIDFITPISGNTPSPRESVDYQFNAQLYRWIDLMGSNPMYTLDISAWYENTDQVLTPIVLVPGATMTMKLLFKKGLVTN